MAKQDLSTTELYLIQAVKGGGYGVIQRKGKHLQSILSSEEKLLITKILKEIGKAGVQTLSLDYSVIIFHHAKLPKRTITNILKSSNAKNEHEKTRWL